MTIGRYEKPKAEHAFIGSWHIYEMELWDEAYFNMDVQAYLEVRSDNLGNFQFGLVRGYLDGYIEHVSGTERFAFTWEGYDEMDPMTGSGWMQAQGSEEVVGLIKLHLGDLSTFRARRAN